MSIPVGIHGSARRLVSCGLCLLAVACADAATGPSGTSPDDLRTRALAAGLVPLPQQPVRPAENPYRAEKVGLGHRLFFDPILSGARDVACSTCHLPRFAFADGRQFPAGAGGSGLGPERTEPAPWPLRPMPRNSPPVFNIGLYGRFGTTPTVNGMMFWAGSAFGLEDQILLPITADNELRGTTYSKVAAIDSVVLRLRATPEYVDLFTAAFPEVAGSATGPAIVTPTTLRLAIAAYLRELITPLTPYDAFLRGDDDALDATQKAGLDLFIGKAGCVQCHRGPALSDFELRVTGVKQMGIGRDTTPGDDLGWGEHGGTPYAFRTAPLREVEHTAPYFHAGSAETLLDVLRFKNAGRSEHPKVAAAQLDVRVRPLGLSHDEMTALVAFLRSLSDPVSLRQPLFQPPARVPSNLEIPQ